jgi:hypothetical protein
MPDLKFGHFEEIAARGNANCRVCAVSSISTSSNRKIAREADLGGRGMASPARSTTIK